MRVILFFGKVTLGFFLGLATTTALLFLAILYFDCFKECDFETGPIIGILCLPLIALMAKHLLDLLKGRSTNTAGTHKLPVAAILKGKAVAIGMALSAILLTDWWSGFAGELQTALRGVH